MTKYIILWPCTEIFDDIKAITEATEQGLGGHGNETVFVAEVRVVSKIRTRIDTVEEPATTEDFDLESNRIRNSLSGAMKSRDLSSQVRFDEMCLQQAADELTVGDDVDDLDDDFADQEPPKWKN